MEHWDFYFKPNQKNTLQMHRKSSVGENLGNRKFHTRLVIVYSVEHHVNIYYSWKCIFTMTQLFHFWTYVLENSRVHNCATDNIIVRGTNSPQILISRKMENKLFTQETLQQSEWNIWLYMDGFQNT